MALNLKGLQNAAARAIAAEEKFSINIENLKSALERYNHAYTAFAPYADKPFAFYSTDEGNTLGIAIKGPPITCEGTIYIAFSEDGKEELSITNVIFTGSKEKGTAFSYKMKSYKEECTQFNLQSFVDMITESHYDLHSFAEKIKFASFLQNLDTPTPTATQDSAPA